MKKLILIFSVFMCCSAWAGVDDALKLYDLYNRSGEIQMKLFGYDNPYLKLYNRTSILEQRAIAARNREQSLANRLLSAAAIGATGIGGAMLGAGLAEQRADAASERDMTAYIETMRCEYANGKTVRGGETNVELPGGNELVALYTEYAELANSLKMRKGELGMSPGIESEIVIDKSDTGLYDNAGVGIVGGGYASVYRALTNPDGADAKMWAEQKVAAEQKTKTGGTVAGAGAVGGLIGNVAINGFDGNGWKKATEETNKNK